MLAVSNYYEYCSFTAFWASRNRLTKGFNGKSSFSFSPISFHT